MNPLYLTEDDVRATLSIADALRLVEDAARALAEGRAQNRPRQRAYTANIANGCVIQVLAAAYDDRLGHKTYTVAPHARGPRFWYTLFANTGEVLALIEADTLGQRRTGAASGVATKYLAREDASALAVIGTGWQARSQLEACAAVRPIRQIRAYGRDETRRRAFCEELSAAVGTTVEPCESAREAVEGADVICTMTSSVRPVLQGAWLQPGAHVNAAGSNRANAQEIDAEVVRRAAIVAVEDVAQAQVESGDLLSAEREGVFTWPKAQLLSDIIAGKTATRTNAEQITLFESLGIGLWDLAAARHVYEACLAQNRGTRLPIPS